MIVPTPPVCVNVTAVYATPAVAAERLAGLTVIVGQLIVIVTLTEPAQPLESVAVTRSEERRVGVGVRERTPADEGIMTGGRATVLVKMIVPTPPVCVDVAVDEASAAVP